MFPLFLSSGLFLGWSLGANDASNVFGTAVGSGMVRFRTAAIICSLFIILGAVFGGAGAAHTLGKLGAVNALAGAFMVALSAAITVYLMTVARYPVSTSQAIVGGIVGWNLFSGSITDSQALIKILLTWIACPALAGVFSVILYQSAAFVIGRARMHILMQDTITRWGLITAGAFGSYALGANNIANVMGVFIPVAPFRDITVAGLLTLSSTQQLFLLGSIAIAVGVFTYSKRVMLTVGKGIFSLSPVAALVVVTAHSLVLFVFSSQELSNAVQSVGLPAIPLVPVSSSQAIVGAVIGIALLRGGRGIRWRTLGGIASSWVTTPVFAAAICFVSLFFLQNVFDQQTYRPVRYELTPIAWSRLDSVAPDMQPKLTERLDNMWLETYEDAVSFRSGLHDNGVTDSKIIADIMRLAELDSFRLTPDAIGRLDKSMFTAEQMEALDSLSGHAFTHRWRLAEMLAKKSESWNPEAADVSAKLRYLFEILRSN